MTRCDTPPTVRTTSSSQPHPVSSFPHHLATVAPPGLMPTTPRFRYFSRDFRIPNSVQATEPTGLLIPFFFFFFVFKVVLFCSYVSLIFGTFFMDRSFWFEKWKNISYNYIGLVPNFFYAQPISHQSFDREGSQNFMVIIYTIFNENLKRKRKFTLKYVAFWILCDSFNQLTKRIEYFFWRNFCVTLSLFEWNFILFSIGALSHPIIRR